MPRVVYDHNGDGEEGDEAPSVDQPEDDTAGPSGGRQHARRLTLDMDGMHDLLMDEVDRAGFAEGLNYPTFRMLFERHPEALFTGLCDHFTRLETRASKAPAQNGNIPSDEARGECHGASPLS